MTTLTNFNTVSMNCTAQRHEAALTLKQKIVSIMYPVLGTMGIAYQIVELMSR